MNGHQVDVHAVTDGKAAAASGVAHAEPLVALAEAAVARDEEALPAAREAVRQVLGSEDLLDTHSPINTGPVPPELTIVFSHESFAGSAGRILPKAARKLGRHGIP